MSATSELRKVAVIQEPGYPLGYPAPCFLKCICGEHVRVADQGVTCHKCQREYTASGWLVKAPQP